MAYCKLSSTFMSRIDPPPLPAPAPLNFFCEKKSDPSALINFINFLFLSNFENFKMRRFYF